MLSVNDCDNHFAERIDIRWEWYIGKMSDQIFPSVVVDFETWKIHGIQRVRENCLVITSSLQSLSFGGEIAKGYFLMTFVNLDEQIPLCLFILCVFFLYFFNTFVRGGYLHFVDLI